MRALDTTAIAARIQEESYRRLGEAGRLRAALDLSDLTHSLAIAGIKSRNPGISDEDARRELATALYVTAAAPR